MEPENGGPLEKEIPIGDHHFQVPCWISGVYTTIKLTRTLLKTVEQTTKKKTLKEHPPHLSPQKNS